MKMWVWKQLVGDRVSHAAVERARTSTHDTSVPADFKVRCPNLAVRRVQVPAQSCLEQDRVVVIVVVVVERTAQSAFSSQHLGVWVDIARHKRSQSVRQVARWPEVANVDVAAGRHELRVVGGAEHDGDHVALQRPPELLRHVVDAQTVLERQVEVVSSLEHVEAKFAGTQRAPESSTTAVYVHVDVTAQLRHVATHRRH